MIDFSNGDVFWFASMLTTGAAAFVCLAIAIVLYLVAYSNERDCEARACPQPTQTAKLMLIDHKCLCVEAAK